MVPGETHWFEFQSGDALLAVAYWLPVHAKGWLTFLGFSVCWLLGPYLLVEHSQQFGLLPGLLVLSSAVFLLALAIKKTKRVKFD